MVILFEFFGFCFFLALGIYILYFCCVPIPTDHLDRSVNQLSLRTRRRFFHHKPDEGASNIFFITSSSNMPANASSSSSMGNTNMVEISIEDLPPSYDDAIVKKPYAEPKAKY